MTLIPVAGRSPASVVKATPAPDDAGAETADRYEWQAMMATADALARYHSVLQSGTAIEGTSDALICEHHEDWVVVRVDRAEIVSAKHREASVGVFTTYRQVLDLGGVLHLFERWIALGNYPLCRLVTTAGFRDDAAKLKTACGLLKVDPETEDELCAGVIGRMATELKSLAGEKNRTLTISDSDVREFLAILRIDDACPRRDHLPDMAPTRYGLPVASLLECPHAATAVWQAILGLVRERMRAAGPAAGGSLPTVLGEPHGEPLESRTLTLVDVDAAVRWAIAHSVGYRPLPRIVKANKMAVKMAHGGCSDNAIERADRLRLQFRRYARARKGMPNDAERRKRLFNALQRVIDEVTTEVRTEETDWGATLWSELAERFRLMEGMPEAQGLDADLLLGGASELVNRCMAWYSDRFDAQHALQLVKDSEGVS